MLNSQYGLAIKLVVSDESPLNLMGKVFMGGDGIPAYFVLAADDSVPDKDLLLGYASADLMLYAQTIGLNTWWIGGTFNRKYVTAIEPTKYIPGIVAVGHGLTQGVPHKSKSPDKVSSYEGDGSAVPQWFIDGVEAALLAPTALNRQAFKISGNGNKVSLTYAGGPLSDVDKGIVKYFFELGAGKDNFEWA